MMKSGIQSSDAEGQIVDKAKYAELSDHNEILPTIFMEEAQKKQFEDYLAHCQAANFQTLRTNRGRVTQKALPPRIITEEEFHALKNGPMRDLS